jgi:hypothetical protein
METDETILRQGYGLAGKLIPASGRLLFRGLRDSRMPIRMREAASFLHGCHSDSARFNSHTRGK